ncbi:hypothetical protein LMH73_012265 [Vibrio splendidus]|nr:hypothetical protein [Vibrio splendidus]MCC4880416.1 hypothetical protein [Vibrio splendidus]
MKNIAILFLASFSAGSYASETNPFQPYVYIEPIQSSSQNGGDIKDLKSILEKSTEGLDFILESNGVSVYYDPKSDKYIEIKNEQ